MAKRRVDAPPKRKADTQPKYPYTTAPAALRRLLKEIPNRPKPGKLSLSTMKTWQVISSNDASPLAVLRKLGLLSANGEPTDAYADFMAAPPQGPRALGARIKDVYKDLFETSHQPLRSNDELRTFFNIHSGGGERTIDLQIQTFKALSENADLSESTLPLQNKPSPSVTSADGGAARLPPVQIDLHIHLPESKTTRDYESIIQDIAKYIYGRQQ